MVLIYLILDTLDASHSNKIIFIAIVQTFDEMSISVSLRHASEYIH